MHSNMYTKIYDIVNKTKKTVNINFKKDFEAEYDAETYSSKENYGYSVLEFIFERYGIATKPKEWIENTPGGGIDTIFNFALDLLIDWKRVCPIHGTAPITTVTKNGYSTKNRPITHYGFVDYSGNPFEVGSVLQFKLLDFKDKEYVWNNPARKFEKYFTYRPVLQ